MLFFHKTVVCAHAHFSGSSFVGLAVIIACIPIPTYVARLTVKVQAEKMKMVKTPCLSMSHLVLTGLTHCQTDKRVQAVTESAQ